MYFILLFKLVSNIQLLHCIVKHEAEWEVEAQLLSSEDPEWRHEEGHSMRYQEGHWLHGPQSHPGPSQPMRGQGW